MANEVSRTAIALFAIALISVATSTPVHAQESASCDLAQRKGPIALLVLPSKAGVREYAASLKGATIIRQDTTTVIFTDGRVVTSDVTAASNHINALGWGSRSIQVVASFSLGRGWRSSGFG